MRIRQQAKAAKHRTERHMKPIISKGHSKAVFWIFHQIFFLAFNSRDNTMLWVLNLFSSTQNFLVHLTISEVAFFLCTHDEIWSYQKSNSFNAFSTQYCPLQNLSSFFQKRNNIWHKIFQNLACFIFHLFQRLFENNNGYIYFYNYNEAQKLNSNYKIRP